MRKEPGFDWLMWTTPIEEINCFLVFLGWEEGKGPLPPFVSAETFGRIPPTSALLALTPYLRSPAKISRMFSDPDKGSLVRYAYRFVNQTMIIEMVTWRIPAHFDPTHNEECASTLSNLNFELDLVGVFVHSHRAPKFLAVTAPGSWNSP